MNLRIYDLPVAGNYKQSNRVSSLSASVGKIFLIGIIMSYSSIVFSQIVAVVNPSSPWTVPAGVTSVTVECWGAGGGGGGAYPMNCDGGGGGGGGAFSTATIAVTSGQTFTIAIGAGGTAGTITGVSGGTGGTTTVTYNGPGGGTCSANGGTGGASSQSGSWYYTINAGGAGGNGGTGFLYAGGNGAPTNGNGGTGGGGGGAGNGGAGINANKNTGGAGGIGGTSPYPGGKGANGSSGYSNNLGSQGNAPGGGGSGGNTNVCSSDAGHIGGPGGAGQVVFLYTTFPICTLPCSGWIAQNCSTCTKGCYRDAGTISPSSSIQTSSALADTTNYSYLYWTFNASADSTYYFDLCSSTGTTGASWLRLHNARITSPGNNYCMTADSTATVVLQNVANGCAGTGTGLSKLIWTCQASGTYYLESSTGAGRSPWGVTGSQTAILSYKTLPSFSYSCSDIFYDKGVDGTNGSVSNYNNDENWIYTYFPTDTVADAISVQFTSFSTSPGDILCVYNGNSINAPVIGCYSGPSITGAFTSTANDGSLTFQFTSDDSLVSSGWQANVSCVGSLRTDKIPAGNKISVYPNPITSSFILQFGTHLKNAEVIICDMLGKELMRKSISGNKMEIEKGNMESGVYYVKVKANEKQWMEKIVVE